MPMIDLKALPAAQLVPLFAGTWRLAEYRSLGATPAGTRVIIEGDYPLAVGTLR